MRLNKTCDLQMWDSVLNLEVLQMRETNWGKLFVNEGVQEIPSAHGTKIRVILTYVLFHLASRMQVAGSWNQIGSWLLN